MDRFKLLRTHRKWYWGSLFPSHSKAPPWRRQRSRLRGAYRRLARCPLTPCRLLHR